MIRVKNYTFRFGEILNDSILKKNWFKLDSMSYAEVQDFLADMQCKDISRCCHISNKAKKVTQNPFFWINLAYTKYGIKPEDFRSGIKFGQSYSSRYLEVITKSGIFLIYIHQKGYIKAVEMGSENYENINELMYRSGQLGNIELIEYFSRLGGKLVDGLCGAIEVGNLDFVSKFYTSVVDRDEFSKLLKLSIAYNHPSIAHYLLSLVFSLNLI